MEKSKLVAKDDKIGTTQSIKDLEEKLLEWTQFFNFLKKRKSRRTKHYYTFYKCMIQVELRICKPFYDLKKFKA